jgi:glycosyltransferase involved in cell wall biosynthesis
MEGKRMRICFFGEFDPHYSRNKVLIDGLRLNKHQVTLCNYEFRNENKTKIGHLLEIFKVFTKLFVKLMKSQYDYILVGYPILKTIWIPFLMGKKRYMIADPFISMYLTSVSDKKLFTGKSIQARFLYYYEKLIFSFGKIILADTDAHAEIFSKMYNIPLNRFQTVLVGADPHRYFPLKNISNKNFIVGFWGKYHPLQGVQYIISAAEILKNHPKIKFVLVGGGKNNKVYQKLRMEARIKHLSNIKFIPHIPENKLPEMIQQSDIQLGIFGNNLKSKIVISNKIYAALAMQKPLLTAESKAIKDYLTTDENCLLCKPADAGDLAEKILMLFENEQLREKIALNGYQTYLHHFTPIKIGEKLQF